MPVICKKHFISHRVCIFNQDQEKPDCILQPFLRLYLLAEHGNCPLVENMLANSRTTLTNRVVRWIAWNMPYHAEHHAWPIVPFHQLPHLHDHLREHLGQVERGYTTFNRSYFERLR